MASDRDPVFQDLLRDFELRSAKSLIVDVEGLWAEISGLKLPEKIPRIASDPWAEGTYEIPVEVSWVQSLYLVWHARWLLFTDKHQAPEDADLLFEWNQGKYRGSKRLGAWQFDWDAWKGERSKLRAEVQELFGQVIPESHLAYRTDSDGEPIERNGGHGLARRKPVKRMREYVDERADGECAICGRTPRQVEDDERSLASQLELDHIIPVALGGARISWNLWKLCHQCNQEKASFLHPRGLLLALSRLRELRQQA